MLAVHPKSPLTLPRNSFGSRTLRRNPRLGRLDRLLNVVRAVRIIGAHVREMLGLGTEWPGDVSEEKAAVLFLVDDVFVDGVQDSGRA